MLVLVLVLRPKSKPVLKPVSTHYLQTLPMVLGSRIDRGTWRHCSSRRKILPFSNEPQESLNRRTLSRSTSHEGRTILGSRGGQGVLRPTTSRACRSAHRKMSEQGTWEQWGSVNGLGLSIYYSVTVEPCIDVAAYYCRSIYLFIISYTGTLYRLGCLSVYHQSASVSHYWWSTS